MSPHGLCFGIMGYGFLGCAVLESKVLGGPGARGGFVSLISAGPEVPGQDFFAFPEGFGCKTILFCQSSRVWNGKTKAFWRCRRVWSGEAKRFWRSWRVGNGRGKMRSGSGTVLSGKSKMTVRSPRFRVAKRMAFRRSTTAFPHGGAPSISNHCRRFERYPVVK